MLKKVLKIAVLSVPALGVMSANAAANGVYVTGQLGYANTHMKDKTTLENLNLPEGAKIKFADPNVDNVSNNGLAERLAIGYQFNQNFAVEVGYLNLASKKVDTIFTAIKNYTGSLKLKQNAIDVAAKGIVPIANNINAYGKIGVAYLTTSFNDKVNDDATDDSSADLTGASGFSKHKWAPEAALGVSYDITPNISVDGSWTHIHPIGNKRPGNIDFVAVGLNYNFG